MPIFTIKENSPAGLALQSMLSGYTFKERFHELLQTHDLKRRNCELRRANDAELEHAQEQVIIYLKASNCDLKYKLALVGAADKVMIASVLREDKPLRLELERGKVDDAHEKLFDKTQIMAFIEDELCKTQDKNKTLDLLRCLRKKRAKKLQSLSADLEYLKRIDLDREDAKMQKDVARLETSISKSKVDYESVKFLNEKYRVMLQQLKDDQFFFTSTLKTIRYAMRQNHHEMYDIKGVYTEAQHSYKKYSADLIHVTKAMTKSQATRNETMATKYRQQATMRFESMRARDIQAANEITSISIVTPTIAQLRESIKAAKMDIMKYAEMFQSMRQKTMVEMNEMISHVVSQDDIFDELRMRKAEMLSKQSRLTEKLDQLRREHDEVKFIAEQSLRDAEKTKNQLNAEVNDLKHRISKCENELATNGNVKHDIVRGIDTLHTKIRTLQQGPSSSYDGCSDCEKLSQCAAKLDQLVNALVHEAAYREAVMKMSCTLFQEPLEDFINIPLPQPHSLPKTVSQDSEEIQFETVKGQSLTRRDLKLRSEALIKLKKKPT